jgi:hypothetical protein
LDHSVLGSDVDDARIDAVLRILRPNALRSTATKNDLRDAMHVATAIRYGASHFVTSDKNILRRKAKLREAFDWFTVLTPTDAVALVRRFIAKDEELQRRSE